MERLQGEGFQLLHPEPCLVPMANSSCFLHENDQWRAGGTVHGQACRLISCRQPGAAQCIFSGDPHEDPPQTDVVC